MESYWDTLPMEMKLLILEYDDTQEYEETYDKVQSNYHGGFLYNGDDDLSSLGIYYLGPAKVIWNHCSYLRWYCVFETIFKFYKNHINLILFEIQKKYEMDMYDRKWRNHTDFHTESNRCKCVKDSAPYIIFNTIEFNRKGFLKLRMVIRCSNRKKGCMEGGGNITIKLNPYDYM